MHRLIYRPILVTGFILGLLIVLELGALSGMTWRNLQRIETIKRDINHGHQIEQLFFELITTDSRNPRATHSRDTHLRILNFLENQYPPAKDTGQLLQKIQQHLLQAEKGNTLDQLEAVNLAHEVLTIQMLEEEQLLDQVYNDSKLELNLAIIVPSFIFLLLLTLGHFGLKKYVVSPINSLDKLLDNLIKGEKTPIEPDQKEKVLRPLFSSYNRLVNRLIVLEQEHLQYTDALEKEVRNATHTLLEQSRSLARADRLAAVGELAASTAHELRNPLAGIKAALENMRNESKNPDFTERLHLVNQEMNRLISRLNELLAVAKQSPEPSQTVSVNKVISELMTLLKYQVDDNITLRFETSGVPKAFLPEGEFRQAILNLLLNSIQSIGTRPGTVTLTVSSQNNIIHIDITDSGPGFPEILLLEGIRPFASYKELGTGLGLAMVQRFARNYHGNLSLRNENGHAHASLNLPAQL